MKAAKIVTIYIYILNGTQNKKTIVKNPSIFKYLTRCFGLRFVYSGDRLTVCPKCLHGDRNKRKVVASSTDRDGKKCHIKTCKLKFVWKNYFKTLICHFYTNLSRNKIVRLEPLNEPHY